MTKFEKRCEDCINLKKVNGILCCDECFGQPITEVDDCPEGIEFGEVEALEQKAKENKVKIVNTADKPKKERKPRERKVDETKVNLIAQMFDYLLELAVEAPQIVKPEKEIAFRIGEDEYSLTLTKHRKPKAQ